MQTPISPLRDTTSNPEGDEHISSEGPEDEEDLLAGPEAPPFRLTFAETVQGITGLIEVAIHTILYVRQVYPVELFVRRQKYNTPVFQSRHPALNEYIAGAMRAVGEEMKIGTVDKVVMVIKNKEHVAMERFIFAVQNMIDVDVDEYHTRVDHAMTSAQMGQYFRSFLVKLGMMESVLEPLHLGDEASFAIVLEVKDNRNPLVPDGKDPSPWIPAIHQHTSAGVSDDAQLHIIRTVNTGIINVSLAIQESGDKLNKVKEKEMRAMLPPAAPPPPPKDQSKPIGEAAEEVKGD